MTEKYTPALGDSVWVKLKGYRFCLWWPGKVVDPQTCQTKYRGKKKLVAAVAFLSDDTITYVNDENSIQPFECAQKESFLECSRKLQHRDQNLRRSFDYDVRQLTENETNPPPPTDTSSNITPAPPTVQLKRTRCRTEPSARTVSSLFCVSSPSMNEIWKTTEACLATDAVSSHLPVSGESIVTDGSTLERCAIPLLDSFENPPTDATDGATLESVRTSPSGDAKSVETSDARPRIFLPSSPPVCILNSLDTGRGSADSPPAITPPVLFSQWRGGKKTSEQDTSTQASPAMSQFPKHTWAGHVFGVLPQTVPVPARIRPSSPTVDDLCRPQAKPPPDLPSEWTPLVSDSSYTVERSTDYTKEANAGRMRDTCGSLQQTHPAEKCSYTQNRRPWSSVLRRWSYHSPKRRRIIANQAVSANRRVPNSTGKLVSSPVRVSLVGTSNRSSSKQTAAITQRQTCCEVMDVSDEIPTLSRFVCTDVRSAADHFSDIANGPPDLLPVSPAPSDQCCALAKRKYSAASKESATSDISADGRSSDVPAATTAVQSLDHQTVAAAEVRSSLDRSSGVANGLPPGLVTSVVSKPPAAKAKSLPHRSTMMTRRQSSLEQSPAVVSRRSSHELVPSTTSPCPPAILPATDGCHSSNPLTTSADRKPWLATVANELVPSVVSLGPTAAITNGQTSGDLRPEADCPVANGLQLSDPLTPSRSADAQRSVTELCDEPAHKTRASTMRSRSYMRTKSLSELLHIPVKRVHTPQRPIANCQTVAMTTELSTPESLINRTALARSAPTRNKRTLSLSRVSVVKKMKAVERRGGGEAGGVREDVGHGMMSAVGEVVASPSPSLSPSCSDLDDLDDDDDDLPQMTLDSGITGPIGVGDLVWLKSRQFPFWPAIVKNVYKRKSRLWKITCCFIGKSSESLHRAMPYTAMFHKKKVVPFSIDPLQHSTLKELGMQSAYASEFELAVKKAEDFICERAVEKTVTSLEFFADEIGSTSTGPNGNTTSPEEDDPTEDHGPYGTTEDHMSDGSVSGSEVSEESNVSDAQRKRIERRREYGRTLVEVIKCDHTKQYLEMIWTGQLKSSRHDQFKQKAMLSREEKWAIKMHGHGPIDDDNQIDELVSTVAKFYKSWASEVNMSYVIDVLVPEAIVYALQKVIRVNKQKAEKIFEKGIRWTKEEVAAFGRDLIRNADNIDPEDRMMYRENANRLARRLSFAV